ncbi:DUF2956 domain-containing protein [Vibrio sp. HA2012]|uniref:DUF2956 domain-containing protein n=1 Tax=Vibrio sp. HA2012 TaxID=1971595 RepID=UPI000C2C0EE5|nr:DUF2956 domain-containing protein [Vibrio sp. HA2012]PJC86584.1 DUF2956 domain-containing protein [Vibrio sp. HA2012]
MSKKSTVSSETQNEAIKIARATQKPGQTKEQTRLIAQGIEKGIAQYKKQQKEKNRQADKAKKKTQRQTVSRSTAPSDAPYEISNTSDSATQTSRLPWILLALSWIGFISFTLLR